MPSPGSSLPEATTPKQTLGYDGSIIYPGQSDLSELHPELRDPYRRHRIYREMLDNSPLISRASADLVYVLLSGAWTMEPTGTTPAHTTALDLATASLQAMQTRLSDVIADQITAVFWGFNWQEITWQVIGGRWLWKRMDRRPQWTLYGWNEQEDGRYNMIQMDQIGQWAVIPADKSIHLTFGQGTGGPEGKAALRHVYVPYRDSRDLNSAMKIGYHRSLAGMPVLYVPPETVIADPSSPEGVNFTAAKSQMAQIERGERTSIILPGRDNMGNRTWELDLLKTGGGTESAQATALYDRYNQQILIGLWAGYLALGLAGASGGSRAVTADQTDTARAVFIGIASAICDAFNAQAIAPLCMMNGIDPIVAPKLKHTPNATIDLAPYAAAIKTLKEAGFLTPQPGDEAATRGVVNLPAPIEPPKP